MKNAIVVFVLVFVSNFANSQGFNHQWLLGSYYFFQDPKGRMLLDNNTFNLIGENRKMPFLGAQANISDSAGNLLMASNGIWIANATGDTMMNGSGLNPGIFADSWAFGNPIDFMNVVLPYPGDSEKYILFHQAPWNTIYPTIVGFYQTTIDLSLDNGLGAVINKNDTLLADTSSWGIGACKHANGRDWWIVLVRDRNPMAYTYLLTPNGIDTMFIQNMVFIANRTGNVSPIVFSPNGKKMIYCTSIDQGPGGSNGNGTVLIYNFDRCTGLLTTLDTYEVSQSAYLTGLAFAPSGNFVYATTSNYVFQIDTDFHTIDTVATFDGYLSPGPNCCYTTFWAMYLAANGKIYITSGSGVQHIHEMNFPDSAGVACDVQQHAISLGYAQLRSVPNHPNYYLGCDTTSGCACLTTGIETINQHDFKFSIAPNPSNGQFKISYLLPQNEKGKFEVFDVNGKRVYEMNLPQWSTMQVVSLPDDVSSGVYNCVLSSGSVRVNKKVVFIN